MIELVRGKTEPEEGRGIEGMEERGEKTEQRSNREREGRQMKANEKMIGRKERGYSLRGTINTDRNDIAEKNCLKRI